jgi:hypothetical protein
MTWQHVWIWSRHNNQGQHGLLDQDVTHAVVAPARAAGARPRYSLVLKVV